MANVKISELRANTNPSGQEELAYAKNGSNGKITLNTIKSFVWQGWWGWGWGWENPANKTQEIFAPGVLPDSRESNTWIFTSNWLHWVEFDWNKAKVYEMATAFDTDWENTLLTTVTAPGDIYMWQLNDEWTRLILIWHLSTWRIMFWVNSNIYDWTPFMFTDEATELTYSEWQGGQQPNYFKSTIDLTSEDYAEAYVEWENEWTWETEQHYANEFKFMWFSYYNWEYWYLYHQETWQYIWAVTWTSEWNEPGIFGLVAWPVVTHNITAILYTWDGWSYPVYAYWDPFETWTNYWYAANDWHTQWFFWDADYAYNNNNQETWNSWIIWDWDWSIWTVNNTTQFIWWNQKYISSDRYLWYDSTKQLVTQYNVRWYGNDWDDDKINVPSLYRFQNDIGTLQNEKQDKIWFTPENAALKVTESNKKPRWLIYNVWNQEWNSFSISFYSNWTKALAAYNYQCAIIDVITPYNITAEELNNAVRSNNYDWISFSDTGWNIFLSENWDYLIVKDWNNDHVYVYELSTPRDVSTITYVAEYSWCRNAIYEGSWTYVWLRELDDNDQVWYWNKYSCANPYEYNHATLTFIEHQWSINPFDDLWNAINNVNSETMFSLDWKQILMNAWSYESWARVFDLSTPFDLSTMDVNNYRLLPGGSWKWQPCWDFIFGRCYKYWYNPNSAYPSLNNVIDWVALVYTPVEWTINNNTLILNNLVTVVDWLSWNITLKASIELNPWMEYTLIIRNNWATFTIDNDTISDIYWVWDTFNYTDWIVKFIVHDDYTVIVLYTAWTTWA